MNGINLASMEASDMLDVIHYIFEQDLRYSTGEEAEAVDKVRDIIYGQLYGINYIFKNVSSKSNRANSFNEFENLQPFDPKRKVTKPYIPPTEFDPDTGMPLSENGLLEAPLN